jgi:hypothetical protein
MDKNHTITVNKVSAISWDTLNKNIITVKKGLVKSWRLMKGDIRPVSSDIKTETVQSYFVDNRDILC